MDLSGMHSRSTGREYVRSRSHSVGDIAYWPIDYLLLTWRHALIHSGVTLLVKPKASLARARSSTHALTLDRIVSQVRCDSDPADTTAFVFEQLLGAFSTAHFVSNLQQKIM